MKIKMRIEFLKTYVKMMKSNMAGKLLFNITDFAHIPSPVKLLQYCTMEDHGNMLEIYCEEEGRWFIVTFQFLLQIIGIVKANVE